MKVIASFDVETLGANVCLHSMVQLGIALFDPAKPDDGPIDCISLDIAEAEGKVREERCIKEFWDKQPGLLDKILSSPTLLTPKEAMLYLAKKLDAWKERGYELEWVANPVSFDWMFLHGYYWLYGPEGKLPLGYEATCLSTLKDMYKEMTQLECLNLVTKEEKAQYPAHIAVNDAILQGMEFMRLKKRYDKKMNTVAVVMIEEEMQRMDERIKRIEDALQSNAKSSSTHCPSTSS